MVGNVCTKLEKKHCVAGPLPLLFIILIAHCIIDGVVHHLLLHVHDFTLFFKLHHDLLNLRKFQLWKQNKQKIVSKGGRCCLFPQMCAFH